ncbi:MAG TPA: peptidase M20, partial [Cyclobacteriaceae bacterium]|nr:peptidase M20 [Cyclobacteriaceae bacterium]
MRYRFITVFFAALAIGSYAQKPKSTTDYQKDMEKLAKQKSVVKAFQIIDELEPETRRDHILLTEIPAPPFKEMERAKQYAKMLEEAGADRVWIDKEGNVIAERKGKKGGRAVGIQTHCASS